MSRTLKERIKKALMLTLPVMTGYISVGIAFGLLSVQAGLPCWCPIMMSIFVYAGALQLVSIGWLVAQFGFVTIFFLSVVVNARQMLYGTSLYKPYSDMGRWKPYMIFALTDETYALFVANPDVANDKLLAITIGLLNQSYWVVGTILGLVISQFASQSIRGVEFSLVALFVTMLLDAWEKKANRMMMISAGLIGLATLVLIGKDYFLLLSMVILILLVLSKERNERDA